MKVWGSYFEQLPKLQATHDKKKKVKKMDTVKNKQLPYAKNKKQLATLNKGVNSG